MKLLSCIRLFATPWTVAYKAPLSMEFSKQEYSSGLPFPSPGDLPDPGIEPRSPALQAVILPSELPGKPPCLLVGRKFGYRGSLCISLVFYRISLATGWFCNLSSHPQASVPCPLEDTMATQWHKRILSKFSLE